VDFYKTARSYNKEDYTLHIHRCEILETNTVTKFSTLFYYFLVLPHSPSLSLAVYMIDDDECGAVGGMRIGRGN
jgi:hypothetical protein